MKEEKWMGCRSKYKRETIKILEENVVSSWPRIRQRFHKQVIKSIILKKLLNLFLCLVFHQGLFLPRLRLKGTI